jgi:hypothetical protein
MRPRRRLKPILGESDTARQVELFFGSDFMANIGPRYSKSTPENRYLAIPPS